MTQSHVMNSAMCNIIWFHWGDPTKCPDGVPSILEQLLDTPKNMKDGRFSLGAAWSACH